MTEESLQHVRRCFLSGQHNQCRSILAAMPLVDVGNSVIFQWVQDSNLLLCTSAKVWSKSQTPLKGNCTLKLKFSMFCALSQNSQHICEKIIWVSWRKLSKKLKNGTTILVVQAVLYEFIDLNRQNIVLINYSITVWPTQILMLF